MQNYKFPGSATGIAIDFMQEDAALNQPDTTGQLYSQYTADPNAIIGQQQVPAVATGQAPVLNQGVVPGHFIQGGGAGLVSAGAGQPLGYGLQQGTTGGTAVDGAGMLGLYGHLVSPSAGTGYGNPVGAVGDQGKAGKGGHKIFDIPSNATNCLYVDGVPSDATEREIARKFIFFNFSFWIFCSCSYCFLDIFRPYPGYICARLIVKESKNGRKFYYCFVDFENSVQASIAMQTLQVSELNFLSLLVLLFFGRFFVVF